MAKNKKKIARVRRDLTAINIIYAVIAFVINILVLWTVFGITRLSSFSKMLFVIINIVALVVLLVMNFLLFMLIRTKQVRFMNTVSAVLIVMLLISGFSSYIITEFNVNTNKIINTGTESESVETSLVVYSASGSHSIDSIEALDGKTVGIMEGSHYGTLAQEELEAKNVKASIVTFTDIIGIAQALFNGEIDCASLPSNYVGLLEVNEGFDEYLANAKVISTFSKVVQVTTDAGSNKDITTEAFTVLILGVDEGRSDAVMLASFNPISMRVTLTSLGRDSYVPIACYNGKSSDKLGHARAVSRQCAIDTIEDLLDIEVDYYFESNFKGVVQMVDALGGIVINNPYEFVGQNSSLERGHKTVWIDAGTDVPVNGEQALAFARERKIYATGDNQRQANQQQVIMAILREAMRVNNVDKAVGVLKAAGDNVSTNMSLDQLISLFKYSMQKVNRYYDTEHPENVFNIVGSRVTGYNSGIWNEGMQITLSIVRLFEGALKDTHNAIIRNLDMTSKIDAIKWIKWDANWTFTSPVIANETYAEKVIVSEVPDKLPNFTTIGRLNTWAKSFNIDVIPHLVGEGMPGYDANLADGTIIWQDVPAGTPAASISVINVNVISKTATPAEATPTTTEHTLTVRYVVKDNLTSAPAAVTQRLVEGATYSVTSPTLSGYSPDVVTVSGTMEKSDKDVTVTYTKIGGGSTPVPVHTWVDGDIVTESICDATGTAIAGTRKRTCAGDSNHGKHEEVKPYTRTDCKKPEHEHTWGEWKIAKPATCTEVGSQTRICTTDSKHTETAVIPMLSGEASCPTHQHNYEWTNNIQIAATCDAEGVEIGTCKADGETTTRSIPKLTEGCPGNTESNTPSSPGTVSLIPFNGFRNNFNLASESLMKSAKNLLTIK